MKIKNIILFFLLVVIAFSCFYEVMAYTVDVDIVSQGTAEGEAKGKITKTVGAVVKIARTIAVGLALIMLAAVAMKYMSAAPGEKAEIKKHAVIYVVGALVLFATGGILTIISNFAENNVKSS